MTESEYIVRMNMERGTGKIKLKLIKNVKEKKVRFKRQYNNYHSLLQRQKLFNYLREELQTSTTHGLPYVVNKRIHYLEKFFWIANFVACLALAALLLNVQYLRFIAAPTVMSVEMNYFEWNISYPAITLCPLYKPDVRKFQGYINKTHNQTGLKIDGYLWAISQAALDTLEYMDLNAPEAITSLIHPKDYAKLAATMFRKFQNSWLATNTNSSIAVEAAMTEMGMCHVINSNVAIYDKPHKWNDRTATYEYVKSNIELSAFEVDFFVQITNYSNMYKVFIHSPDEIPTSTTSSFGFDVEGIISFGLTVWSSRISDALRYTSLHLRKCRFNHESISRRYPIYSFSHCVKECKIRMIKKLCGCVPHFYKPLSDERICYISELKCVLHYRREIVTLEASKETLRKFKHSEDLPRISRDCGCLSTCELDLYYKDHEEFEPQSGLHKLIIKITSFPKVRVMRDIIFNFYDIVLKSGGVVNLCIGSSIISIMEFLLVGFKVCIYILIKFLRQLKKICGFLISKAKTYLC